MKDFSELTKQELLALAIRLEEKNIRTYADPAEGMRESYPGTARMFRPTRMPTSLGTTPIKP